MVVADTCGKTGPVPENESKKKKGKGGERRKREIAFNTWEAGDNRSTRPKAQVENPPKSGKKRNGV